MSDSDSDEFYDAEETIVCSPSLTNPRAVKACLVQEGEKTANVLEKSSLNDLPDSSVLNVSRAREQFVAIADDDLLGYIVDDRTKHGHMRPAVSHIIDAVRTDATHEAQLDIIVSEKSNVHSYVEGPVVESYTPSVSSEVALGLEPDIVQSTKSNSLNRSGNIPPLRPVAPPRKKKGPAPLPPSSSATLEPIVKLSVESLTEGVNSMAGVDIDSDLVLDIGSATRGSRIVTAVEDDSAKASPGEKTNLDDEEIDNAVTVEDGTQVAIEARGSSSSLVTITLGVLNGKENGEDYSKPLSITRPRSNSGSRYLTDQEILDQVYVVNLDSGETLPLSLAEEKLPKCINPLSLHIMRRTKEYSSDSSLPKQGDQSDDDVLKETSSLSELKPVKQGGKKKRKIKKFFGKTAHKIKSVADGVFHGDETVSDDEDHTDVRRVIKVKASHSHKGPYDFDLLVPVQELTSRTMGAVWTMKFSHCGRLLATGGQDNLLRVWVLKSAHSYFDDMRRKYTEAAAAKVSPSPSQERLNTTTSYSSPGDDSASVSETSSVNTDDGDDEHMPFVRQPFSIFRGHTADLLDVSWSKNYFILSSSMDKTVRLWHVSRRECLCCFQHIDFVTAIAFHPKDDRYFLSGSLDGKLRLWNIPDKKVALWNEVEGVTKLITAANFCMNGKLAVVGTYDGRCIFYSAEHLKYHTQINVRSTRGRNARGRKITGVEPMPGEDKILVTSNDSRIRLYDLRDLTLTCKYKGCCNSSSQIKANFSHDGQYIICGSEDRSVYIWKTQHEFYKFSSARRDRNDYWESVRAHAAVVTNAIFAPCPDVIIKSQSNFMCDDDGSEGGVMHGEVLVSADYAGVIRVFINKFKPACD